MAGFDPLNSSAMQYNNPTGGVKSSTDAIDAPAGGIPGNKTSDQIRTAFYDRKALYETRKERYFAQLADVIAMPKHYGKKISKYHIMPLLDDRNINDEGIDAQGAVKGANNLEGNLYGSSKDIGNIQSRLPTLSENGGRVNRVGFSRIQLEGTMENYGIFTEFTDDFLNFDSMSDLYEHISRELVSGAVQMTEAMIQMDIIDACGLEYFGGEAAALGELTGEVGATLSITDYEDLQRLSIALDDTRTPKSMKMIKGSQGFDTVTVDNGRLLYCGSEMIPTFTKMTDHFGNPAFVSVEHYGYAGSYKEGTGMIHGEIGKVGQFRIIVVPEMLHKAGVGAVVADNAGYRATDGNYDAFPLLCIGSESFTTVGFQTGGGNDFKFKIITRMPGEIVTLDDPYAKTGFSSLQFWYGFMTLRPERLAVSWSIAEQ